MEFAPPIADRIVSYVRAGTHPYIAAEACGLDEQSWMDWMRRLDEPFVGFQARVRAAAAEARVAAEIEVRRKKPLEWLTKGPGKSTPGRPGWSERVEMTGPDGGPITPVAALAGPDLDKLSPEELDQYEALLAKLQS